MWSKLDDALLDHRKIFAAGELIGGPDGPGLALGIYTAGLLWTNKHMTNGYLPLTVVKRWPHFARPLKLAEALVSAGLWEKTNGGFDVHDYADHNFTAEAIAEHRAHVRAARAKAGRAGGFAKAAAQRRKSS